MRNRNDKYANGHLTIDGKEGGWRKEGSGPQQLQNVAQRRHFGPKRNPIKIQLPVNEGVEVARPKDGKEGGCSD